MRLCGLGGRNRISLSDRLGRRQLFEFRGNLMRGNATCFYNIPGQIASRLRLPGSETGNFTSDNVRLTVIFSSGSL